MTSERLRGLFRYFAATQCRGRSPVYETLSQSVAEDDTLLALLMNTPDEQRRPSLLFAAVNLLLHPDARLAAYYPIHGGTRPVDAELPAAFADFCAEHAVPLADLLRTRSTQTNEIRRCTALRLALDHVVARWPGPVALVEVGASAGLNLLFDRYESAGAPEITSRLGIDLHPIDLTDPAQRSWLQAFVWPEDVEGLATLRQAIDVALTEGLPPVVQGDATTDTARLLTALPGDEPIVVFTASLLSYLGTEARAAFLAQLDLAARQRPIAWTFAESPGLLATVGLHLPSLAGPLARRNGLYAVGASLRTPPGHDDTILAMADPYLRWMAPARQESDDFEWLAG